MINIVRSLTILGKTYKTKDSSELKPYVDFLLTEYPIVQGTNFFQQTAIDAVWAANGQYMKYISSMRCVKQVIEQFLSDGLIKGGPSRNTDTNVLSYFHDKNLGLNLDLDRSMPIIKLMDTFIREILFNRPRTAMITSMETPTFQTSSCGFIFLTYLMEACHEYDGKSGYHKQITLQEEATILLNLIGIIYCLDNKYEDWIMLHPDNIYGWKASEGISNP